MYFKINLSKAVFVKNAGLVFFLQRKIENGFNLSCVFPAFLAQNLNTRGQMTHRHTAQERQRESARLTVSSYTHIQPINVKETLINYLHTFRLLIK